MPWPTFTANDDPVQVLVKLSQFYGSDADFVLAGGGNTSVKLGDRLFIKASGYPLATLTRKGLVELDRTKLTALLQSDLGQDRVQREERFKSAIMASRFDATSGKRPSVESLVHHVVPGQYVIHTHATVVNTLTCAHQGESLCQQLFGDMVLWIPVVDPGFPLAQLIHERLESQRQPEKLRAILMANHGLIVFGDDPQTIRDHTDFVLQTITQKLGPVWEQTLTEPERIDNARLLVNTLGPLLRGLLSQGSVLKVVSFDDRDLVMRFVGTPQGKQLVKAGPLTPDQIVYCQSFPLWIEIDPSAQPQPLIEQLRHLLAEHEHRTGQLPG